MMTKLHPIMLAGTASDVGKSVLSTALCRIFFQDGLTPAPFKAQNMALNSFVTSQGYEIGRAQATQAEAAGIECHVDMNPLLLKPQSDHTSQVVINGIAHKAMSAQQLFKNEIRRELRQVVCNAFDRLSKRYNPIVMEGAGSIAELNLQDKDIVNLSMAEYAKADVLLIGDIDRGGIFASLYGTMELIGQKERNIIKGIIINKFRGDRKLFDDGVKMIEKLCKIPVLGVIPYFENIHIAQEDSVDLEKKMFQSSSEKVNIAVIMLKRISNFTDFDALERDSRVHLFYADNALELRKADIIIVPGTKNTIADLKELQRNGMAKTIREVSERGVTVLGICGGYQMLGLEINDPLGIESEAKSVSGIGLLPIRTVISNKKITRRVKFTLCNNFDENSNNAKMTGYEIHMGITSIEKDQSIHPLTLLENGNFDGCYDGKQCMGTYIHGILDNAFFVDFLLKPFAKELKEEKPKEDFTTYKEKQYNMLAEHVRRNMNINELYNIMRREQ